MYGELMQACLERYGSGDSSISLGDWISQNTTIRRRPFSYADYPFQKALADDEHHSLACEKCAQVGLTEIQIRKYLAMLRRNPALSGIYTLPNEKMFKRIYNARIKPILDNDQIFNPPMAIQPVRRMDLIQIFDSFGYITGCNEGDATSISADFLFHDELDLSPMDMIGLFQSRLQNSSMKMTQSFSTPSFIDYGINREYNLSDQREYSIKCESCNHWQIPKFEMPFINWGSNEFDIEKPADLTPEIIASMDMSEVFIRCERCKKRLDLNNAKRREWVATYPTRTNKRGYKVRPFSTGRISLPYIFSQLADYQGKDYIRGFYNTVLGEPFTESSAQLQRNEIEDVMTRDTPVVSKDDPVFLGLDIGAICHLTLMKENLDGSFQFFLFEQIPIFQLHERLKAIRDSYSVIQGCVDRYPFTPTVEAFRDESAGILMPIHYGGNAIIAPVLDEVQNTIYYRTNRTSALDRVRTVIVNKQVVLSGYGPYRETLITHLRDMVRDEKPEVDAEWKTLNRNDHFFHSMAYCLLARRVCDHVYTNNSSSLKTNAMIFGMPIPAKTDTLNPNVGVNRISRLGAK